MEHFDPSREEVVAMRISNEDIQEWYRALHEGGFSSNEIDYMLNNLNFEYAKARIPGMIDKFIAVLEEKVMPVRRRPFTEQERAIIEKLLEEHWGKRPR